MLSKWLTGAVVLAAGLSLAGCWESNSNEAPAASVATTVPAAQPAKAFWKTQKVEVTAAQDITGTAPLPSWSKLPPINPALVAEGKALFDTKGCAACHGFGKKIVGPDLDGVTSRDEPQWLEKWIADPNPMLDSDAHAKEMLAKFLVKMPNQQVKPAEIKAIIEFLRQHDEKVAHERGERRNKKDHE